MVSLIYSSGNYILSWFSFGYIKAELEKNIDIYASITARRNFESKKYRYYILESKKTISKSCEIKKTSVQCNGIPIYKYYYYSKDYYLISRRVPFDKFIAEIHVKAYNKTMRNLLKNQNKYQDKN